MSEGKKHDQNKEQLHLIPTLAQFEVARGMMFGRQQYGQYNYLNGMDWSRLIDAAQRHILKFWAGEEKAADSQVHHLAHAACNLMMLLEYSIRGIGKDDRFKQPLTEAPKSDTHDKVVRELVPWEKIG